MGLKKYHTKMWTLLLPRMHLIPIPHLSNYEILRGTSERYCYFEGKFD